MAKLTGSIVDRTTGNLIESRVQVLQSDGLFAYPKDALQKIGPGLPFFYSNGKFEIDVQRGPAKILVERGTEYTPAELVLEIPSTGITSVDIEMDRWSKLGDEGWHPGNTHIHYQVEETRPDERLQLDPRVEDLRMTAISILKRWDLEYASNKYPPGMLTEFSSTNHYVQCGEENRHNIGGSHDTGYGHIMLLNIRNIVEPVSRGLLVDKFDPDYPPLSYACDDTHRQGGIVIWCHNGSGLEAPVAAALGKLDAFNLFDPHWMDPEYDIYYLMLNAGIKLPASTGSDWYISSANRVYANTGETFEYDSWLQALVSGKTFITNGPSLTLSVDGQSLGSQVEISPGKSVNISSSWESHYPISKVEILYNGRVVSAKHFSSGSKKGSIETGLETPSNGWIAARLSSNVRDSFFQPIFAHTSPIYIYTGTDSIEKKEAARWFDASIESSLEWVGTKGKFYSDRQRKEVKDLFREGQKVYQSML